MKRLLFMSLFLVGGMVSTQLYASPSNVTTVTDGITAKVFKLEFKAPIQNQKELSKLKTIEGIINFESQGQYNTLLVVFAEPWMTQEGLLNIVKPMTDGQFQIIGEEIKTLDESLLTK